MYIATNIQRIIIKLDVTVFWNVSKWLLCLLQDFKRMADRKNNCYYLQNGSKYYQKVVIYLNVVIDQKQNISFRSDDK